MKRLLLLFILVFLTACNGSNNPVNNQLQLPTQDSDKTPQNENTDVIKDIPEIEIPEEELDLNDFCLFENKRVICDDLDILENDDYNKLVFSILLQYSKWDCNVNEIDLICQPFKRGKQ